jgi:hypothetical protein
LGFLNFVELRRYPKNRATKIPKGSKNQTLHQSRKDESVSEQHKKDNPRTADQLSFGFPIGKILIGIVVISQQIGSRLRQPIRVQFV